jgi:hypothetical protein
MEGWQRSLMNEWRWPLWTMLIMYACIYLYVVIRANAAAGVPWHATIAQVREHGLRP